ncbi:Translation initiation factor IF-2 [Moraxella atlantae]|uniref:Translation initiation factor IF-2 n=1 Tax=Faucicola atlantae TaxID=34059 RepID=A0A378QLM4_9GAMM|nr:Translation initiation factor IF-2 [Moraxella atlantae]
MADKTVKQLAAASKTTTDNLKQQLVSAGLSARGDNDIVTDQEQEQLVAFLQQSHGQKNKSRISLKSKTTTTAKVTGTSGRAKNVNVEVRKKMVFDKPDPQKIAEELAAREQAAKAAAEKARIAAEKAAAEKAAKEQAQREAEARQQATLAAMRANTGASNGQKSAIESASVVVKKGSAATDAVVVKKPAKKTSTTSKPAAKKETDAQRRAREAEEQRLRDIEQENRRKAAEEAQQRTLEQMRQMASKYADNDVAATTVVRKDEPLAEGLVGAALEDSFEQERREIKRGSSGNTNRNRRRRRDDDGENEVRSRSRGLKSSQANRHKFEKPVDRIVHDVEIGESIIVSDLAQKMAIKAREVVKTLMKMGELVRENETIDQRLPPCWSRRWDIIRSW